MCFSNQQQTSKLAQFAHGSPRPKPGYGGVTPDSSNGSIRPKNCTGAPSPSNRGSPSGQNPTLPKVCYPTLVMRCCCEDTCNQPPQGPKLTNVDAMDELCYFTKNDDDKYDCYQVCKCCGVMTKYDTPQDPGAPTPIKYARRQRFTFNDDSPESKQSKACSPPWPFKCPCLCCPEPSCNCGCCCCCDDCCCGGESNGLPKKTGVYYFNRSKNRLVFQPRKDKQKDKCKLPPPTPSSCGDSYINESENPKTPVVIQPYVLPPPVPACGGGGNPCSKPCNPCIHPSFSPFCKPCGRWCNPCPGCCNPCYNPCYNPCCSPCCNPCCNPCAPISSNCCPPPPKPVTPPSPVVQETVIPMCIPVHPPPFCTPPCCDVKKKSNRKDSRRKKSSRKQTRSSGRKSNET